jgi:astacin (peptidase family M12A)
MESLMAKRPAGNDKGTSGQDGEQRGGPKMGTAVISGNTFTNRSVVYYDLDGIAMVEGDIALGSVAEVEKAMEAAREAGPIAFGVGITGAQFRWPNCRIPYEIDAALPNKNRVTDAIAHWESKTPFRFPLRTAANAAQFPDYVRFTDASGCWSRLGRQGGQQIISLGTGCTTGNAIHEIGHTVGLWHEQSREDRDLFVTIKWQNIQTGMAAQFNQHITDGDDLGPYDYGSIMHYPRTAFSKNDQDTIVPTNPANAQIGQRQGLSAGDIAAVKAMYPGCAWPGTGGNFKKVVDDPSFKKTTDDSQFKKIRDDIVFKPAFDPPGGIGPVKTAGRDVRPLPGTITTLPGGRLQPFSLATAHHAAMAPAAAMADASAMSYLATLQQEMLDTEAALAQAKATAAQATAEAARLQQASHALAVRYQEAMSTLGDGSS